jgi:hypothetical protein
MAACQRSWVSRALLSLSVLEKEGDTQIDPARFRAWQAKLLHQHLERT